MALDFVSKFWSNCEREELRQMKSQMASQQFCVCWDLATEGSIGRAHCVLIQVRLCFYVCVCVCSQFATGGLLRLLPAQTNNAIDSPFLFTISFMNHFSQLTISNLDLILLHEM